MAIWNKHRNDRPTVQELNERTERVVAQTVSIAGKIKETSALVIERIEKEQRYGRA